MIMQYVSGTKKLGLLMLAILSLASCGRDSAKGSPANQNTIEDEQGSIEGTISSLLNTLLPAAYANEVVPLCTSSCSGLNCAELHIFDSGLNAFVLECRTDAVLNDENKYDYKFVVNKKQLANRTYKIVYDKEGSRREAISYHHGELRKELNLSLESTFKSPLAEKALEGNRDEDPGSVIERVFNEINFDRVKQALIDNKLLPDDCDDSDLDNALKLAPDEINEVLKKQYSDEKSCLNSNLGIAEDVSCTLQGDEYDKLKEMLKEEFYERIDADGDGVLNASDCAPDDKNASLIRKLYLDQDLDGFGSASLEEKCLAEQELPEGYSENDLDCDDSNGDLNLSCEVIELDSDLDGIKDEEDCDPKNPDFYYYRELFLDKDEDGLGSKEVVESVCAGKELLPPSWVDNANDCDDNNPKIGEKCEVEAEDDDGEDDDDGREGEEEYDDDDRDGDKYDDDDGDDNDRKFKRVDFSKLYEKNSERSYDFEEYGSEYLAFKDSEEGLRLGDFILRNESCEQPVGYSKKENAFRLCASSPGEKPGHLIIFKGGVSEVRIVLRYVAKDSKEAKAILRSFDPEEVELLSQSMANGEDVELIVKAEKLSSLSLQLETDSGAQASIIISRISYRH